MHLLVWFGQVLASSGSYWKGIESIELFFKNDIHKKKGSIGELVFQDKEGFFCFSHFFSKGVPWEFGTRICVSSKRLDVLAYLLLAVNSGFGRRLKMKNR